jgi:hypothetical protein
LSLFNRQYSIEIDTLHDRFKDEIINPWIRKLREEGEKTLLRTTETSFKAAKELMTSALLEKEARCKRELEEKNTIAIYCNLLAAEEALRELFIRTEGLQARIGQ